MQKIEVLKDNEYCYRIFYTTKEDVLNQIDETEAEIRIISAQDYNRSSAYYHSLLDLLERFKRGVEELVLFKDLEACWHYEVAIGNYSISLMLIHDDPVYDNEDIVDFVPDQTFRLYEEKGRTLTVEEYAEKYNVENTTVRQWIRRGKIRSAFKQGNEWRIPELTDLPSRGFVSARYHWTQVSDVPEEFKYLSDYNMIFIDQDKENRKVYEIFLYKDDEYRPGKYITMSGKEKEKLELYLISNPSIIYDPDYTETITVDYMEYYSKEYPTNGFEEANS